jgi:putative transcriptional regulator
VTRSRRPPLGERLIDALRTGAAAIREETPLVETEVILPPPPRTFNPEQLVALRSRFRMTQGAMAAALNVSPKTVESWEQGIRRPGGAALRLLQILEDPTLLRPPGKPHHDGRRHRQS